MLTHESKWKAEQQLKMLSVQLEQGRHGAIVQAQEQVRLRGGNALLGVTFNSTHPLSFLSSHRLAISRISSHFLRFDFIEVLISDFLPRPSVNMCSQAGPIVVLTGTAVYVE